MDTTKNNTLEWIELRNFKYLIKWNNGKFTEAEISCSSQEKAMQWATSLCKKHGGMVVEAL